MQAGGNKEKKGAERRGEAEAERAIGRKNYTLLGKQKLYLIDRIFFNLLGTIWVDRKNKKETAEVKNKILRYLNRGQSVLWFP